MQNVTPLSSAERNKIYRERLRAAGGEEVLFKLPSEIVILLDQLKERQGLRNRSQALMQLIEHGRATAQQML
jgi:transposase